MVLRYAEADRASLASFEAKDFFERFTRHEDGQLRALLVAAAVTLGEVNERHAMAVRGQHLHLGWLYFQQRAVELESGFFVRDREFHFRDHGLELIERDGVR